LNWPKLHYTNGFAVKPKNKRIKTIGLIIGSDASLSNIINAIIDEAEKTNTWLLFYSLKP
jgi:DNA-binding LacI/PurR family transcriptional regulator